MATSTLQQITEEALVKRAKNEIRGIILIFLGNELAKLDLAERNLLLTQLNKPKAADLYGFLMSNWQKIGENVCNHMSEFPKLTVEMNEQVLKFFRGQEFWDANFINDLFLKGYRCDQIFPRTYHVIVEDSVVSLPTPQDVSGIAERTGAFGLTEIHSQCSPASQTTEVTKEVTNDTLQFLYEKFKQLNAGLQRQIFESWLKNESNPNPEVSSAIGKMMYEVHNFLLTICVCSDEEIKNSDFANRGKLFAAYFPPFGDLISFAFETNEDLAQFLTSIWNRNGNKQAGYDALQYCLNMLVVRYFHTIIKAKNLATTLKAVPYELWNDFFAQNLENIKGLFNDPQHNTQFLTLILRSMPDTDQTRFAFLKSNNKLVQFILTDKPTVQNICLILETVGAKTERFRIITEIWGTDLLKTSITEIDGLINILSMLDFDCSKILLRNLGYGYISGIIKKEGKHHCLNRITDKLGNEFAKYILEFLKEVKSTKFVDGNAALIASPLSQTQEIIVTNSSDLVARLNSLGIGIEKDEAKLNFLSTLKNDSVRSMIEGEKDCVTAICSILASLETDYSKYFFLKHVLGIEFLTKNIKTDAELTRILDQMRHSYKVFCKILINELEEVNSFVSKMVKAKNCDYLTNPLSAYHDLLAERQDPSETKAISAMAAVENAPGLAFILRTVDSIAVRTRILLRNLSVVKEKIFIDAQSISTVLFTIYTSLLFSSSDSNNSVDFFSSMYAQYIFLESLGVNFVRSKISSVEDINAILKATKLSPQSDCSWLFITQILGIAFLKNILRGKRAENLIEILKPFTYEDKEKLLFQLGGGFIRKMLLNPAENKDGNLQKILALLDVQSPNYDYISKVLSGESRYFEKPLMRYTSSNSTVAESRSSIQMNIYFLNEALKKIQAYKSKPSKRNTNTTMGFAISYLLLFFLKECEWEMEKLKDEKYLSVSMFKNTNVFQNAIRLYFQYRFVPFIVPSKLWQGGELTKCVEEIVGPSPKLSTVDEISLFHDRAFSIKEALNRHVKRALEELYRKYPQKADELNFLLNLCHLERIIYACTASSSESDDGSKKFFLAWEMYVQSRIITLLTDDILPGDDEFTLFNEAKKSWINRDGAPFKCSAIVADFELNNFWENMTKVKVSYNTDTFVQMPQLLVLLQFVISRYKKNAMEKQMQAGPGFFGYSKQYYADNLQFASRLMGDSLFALPAIQRGNFCGKLKEPSPDYYMLDPQDIFCANISQSIFGSSVSSGSSASVPQKPSYIDIIGNYLNENIREYMNTHEGNAPDPDLCNSLQACFHTLFEDCPVRITGSAINFTQNSLHEINPVDSDFKVDTNEKALGSSCTQYQKKS